jgi:hypothetical protein
VKSLVNGLEKGTRRANGEVLLVVRHVARAVGRREQLELDGWLSGAVLDFDADVVREVEREKQALELVVAIASAAGDPEPEVDLRGSGEL